MIILIYFLLIVLTALISYVKFKRFLNITSVFSGIWFVFGLLSCFGLYGLRIPEVKTHLYIWLFVILVDILFWTFAVNGNVEQGNEENNQMQALAGKKLQIAAIILALPMAMRLIPLLIETGSMEEVRIKYFSGTLFNSMYMDVLFRNVPIAFFNALIVYNAFYAFEMKAYKYLLYGALNAGFVTLINGGRYALLMLLYTIFILWITGAIDTSTIKRNVRFKNKAGRIGVVMGVALIAVTVLRGQDIIRSVVTYFTGSVAFLDYIVNTPTLFALDKPLYGYLTFGAILEPIVLVLKVLNITTAKVPSYEFNIYGQEYYNVGDGKVVMMNANTTIIYYFLRDFGTVGVVVGALFIGALAVAAYNKWKKGSKFWGLVFCYMGNVLFNSLMTYQLFGQAPLFMILAFILCTTNVRIKKYGTR